MSADDSHEMSNLNFSEKYTKNVCCIWLQFIRPTTCILVLDPSNYLVSKSTHLYGISQVYSTDNLSSEACVDGLP